MKHQQGYRFLDPATLARIKSLSLAARGVVEGFIAGLHASPHHGFSIEFAEHRNYVRGDNLRHLDWRMLARTDRLYVKQYQEETNLRAQILFDTSSSMLYRSGKSLSKLEYGAYLVAILALMMTRQQDAVGLTTFDEQLRLDMPARTSPRHFGEMMRQLEGACDELLGVQPMSRATGTPGPHQAKATPRTGLGTNIADTLHCLAERFKRRCLVVLISDLYEDPDAVMRALHHFRHRHHEVILFHLFDEAEIEFPFRDATQFIDMETGEQLQIDPRYVRDDYKQQIQTFIDTYRKACADVQIDYVMTHTSVPYDIMLSHYLSKRSTL